jgi:ATP-dependent DNA helicase RecQ
MISPATILKKYWNHDAFRPLQEEIIHSVLAGKDTLALLPTGGGKSLCFQVPAMAMEGLCLVISPLIALMKDQVENLRRRNITAFAIYSGMTRKEVIATLRTACESNCKFLYVSPERLETSLFKEWLPGLHVQLIAVDEAHCISQWGYDFRPSYLHLAALREELDKVPILALTASATPEVQRDICDKLLFKDPSIFRQSFARENLSFSVFKVDSRINKILQILQNVPGCAIVYCKSRKRCKQICDLLNMQGISAGFYHAGLTHEERNQRQENWIQNKIRVIVCTNAFGMGIDKPDVKVVIHAEVPDCLENYYQEAGRAGRDMKKAYAVLLHAGKDLEELTGLSAVRFPSFEEIRKVFEAVVNYLQVPAGGGEGIYYDFDMADFVEKFKLDPYLVLYVLKALEQEDMLAFNEQVFLSSKIVFKGNKESLNAFEKDDPEWEPLIKCLLRTYSGIFDQPVPIYERTLARLLAKDLAWIETGLRTLHAYNVIDYAPQKDKPQLCFMRPRPAIRDLRIDQQNYAKRKKQFEQRIATMIRYTGSGNECRSQFIAGYFGDESTKPCGICDHCLSNKSDAMTREEFDFIRKQITEWVTTESVPSQELIGRFSGIRREKLWEVINYLQSENKLIVDKEGMVRTR